MPTQFSYDKNSSNYIGNYFNPEEQQKIQEISFQGGSSSGGSLDQYFTYGGKQFVSNVAGGGDYVENYRKYLDAINNGSGDQPTIGTGIAIPTQTAGQPTATPTFTPLPVNAYRAPTSSGPTIEQSQLFVRPGETPEQYNIRIASLRGDSATGLANIQSLTQQAIANQPKTNGQVLGATAGVDYSSALPKPTAQGTQESYLASLIGATQPKYQAALLQQRDEANARVEALYKQLNDIASQADPSKDPNYAQRQRILQNELNAAESASAKLQKNFEDNQALTDELDKLLTEGNELIAQQKAQTGLAAIRNPRINKTIEDVASRASVITAVMNARDGQINQAQDMIAKAVDSANASRTDRINYFNSILELTTNKALALDTNEKTYIEAQIKQLESEMKLAESNAQNISDMMTNPDTAMLLFKAGVKLTDPPEVVAQKIAKQQAWNLANGFNANGTEKAKATGLGVPGKISPTTQAIINNPSLFDDLTPTVRGQVLSELQNNGYDTTNLGVKGLSDTAIQSVAQTEKAIEDLNGLKTIIENNFEFIGPISGLAALNPWSKARQVQADINRVKQTVGKALEGGVLRKEDEEKYKKILATLTDTPETAIYKINALLSSIQRDIENYKSLQQSAGRSLDVGASLGKVGEIPTIEELRAKYGY